ncbi:MAG: hypothetical protein QOE36_2038 [Gaiellaceae bacterium]|jgi:hypothetical protein|nr:hypothetical protein [Gaiellaceae bacterium]
MGLFGDKSDWLDAQATVLSEEPKGGTSGDTKHGRDYFKKNELQLSLALPTGQVETVTWKGNVPKQICYSMRGRTLPCKVHPEKHDKLEFDWDEITGFHKLHDAPGATVEAAAPESFVSMSPPQVTVTQGPTLTGEAAQEALDRLGIHIEQTGSGVKITRDGVETEAVASTDPLDRLEKLGKLRDEGLLTQEEFETQKTKLLGT